MRLIALAAALFFAGTCAAMAAAIPTNSTALYYGPGHGTQVEYLGADGRTYLWYPGNKVVLPGRWKLQGSKVCFRYGENTYNPVTGAAGAVWECEPIKAYMAGQAERAVGDIFGLAHRVEVPFALSPAETTIAALASKLGLAAPPTKKTAAPAIPGMPAGATLDEQCASIVADAQTSRPAMVLAAFTYFNGFWHGKKCVDIDYARSFALLRQAGDTRSIDTLTKVLRQRAATGNLKAISNLKKLGISP